MILEALVTTCDESGAANISPMGPIMDEGWRHFTLRPFQTSRTYRNLKREGVGVLHVSDDVEVFAQAAIGKLTDLPNMRPAAAVQGWILEDACRWYAFRVQEIDDSEDRTVIRCEVVEHGRQRDFFGFNRAKHAVLEAAILATRIEFLPKQQILDEYERLESPVQKTASDQERRAFQLLKDFVESAIGGP